MPTVWEPCPGNTKASDLFDMGAKYSGRIQGVLGRERHIAPVRLREGGKLRVGRERDRHGKVREVAFERRRMEGNSLPGREALQPGWWCAAGTAAAGR